MQNRAPDKSLLSILMYVFSGFFVLGDTASAPQQDAKELVVQYIPIPSPLAKHVNGAKRTPQQTNCFFRFRRQSYKTFYFLPAAAVLLLVLSVYLCRLKPTENVQAWDCIRRLARGEDGKGGKNKAASRASLLCGLLEEAVISSDEEEGSSTHAPPLQRSATLSEGAEMNEKRRTKKRKKTNWLEEGATCAAEKARKTGSGERLKDYFMQPATKNSYSFLRFPRAKVFLSD